MEKDILAKIIGFLFMSRTAAHMSHLQVTGPASFARHKALNEFYDEIVDMTDSLAETAQGKFGILDIPYMDLKGDVSDPIGLMETHLTMVENLGKKCENRALQNIFDEIVALYMKTLYLLKNLE